MAPSRRRSDAEKKEEEEAAEAEEEEAEEKNGDRRAAGETAQRRWATIVPLTTQRLHSAVCVALRANEAPGRSARLGIASHARSMAARVGGEEEVRKR